MEAPRLGNRVKGRTLSEIGTSAGKVSLCRKCCHLLWVGQGMCVQETSEEGLS